MNWSVRSKEKQKYTEKIKRIGKNKHTHDKIKN